MQLRVENKTQQMLLAFAGDHLKADADFLQLQLSAEHNVEVNIKKSKCKEMVQLKMNLGSGVVDLTHPTTLQPGRWHIVSIIR